MYTYDMIAKRRWILERRMGTKLPISLDLRQINEIIKTAFPGKRVMAVAPDSVILNIKSIWGSSETFVLRLFSEDGKIADKELSMAQLVRQTVPVADFI